LARKHGHGERKKKKGSKKKKGEKHCGKKTESKGENAEYTNDSYYAYRNFSKKGRRKIYLTPFEGKKKKKKLELKLGGKRKRGGVLIFAGKPSLQEKKGKKNEKKSQKQTRGKKKAHVIESRGKKKKKVPGHLPPLGHTQRTFLPPGDSVSTHGGGEGFQSQNGVKKGDDRCTGKRKGGVNHLSLRTTTRTSGKTEMRDTFFRRP